MTHTEPDRRPGPAFQRIREAPASVWAYAALALATPPFIGVMINEYALTDLGAWRGLGIAVLLAAGLLLRWQVIWVAAAVIDLYLVVTGLVEFSRAGVAGVLVAGKAAVAIGLLLTPSLRQHVFGSVQWRDPDEAPAP